MSDEKKEVKSWKDILTTNRVQMYVEKEEVEQCYEWLGKRDIENGRFIPVGAGHARVVFLDTSNDTIVKVAKPGFRECNIKEYALSGLKDDVFLSVVAPVKSMECDGNIITMDPCKPLIHEIVIMSPMFFDYSARRNFGWLSVSDNVERLVSLDYDAVSVSEGGKFHPTAALNALHNKTVPMWSTFWKVGDHRLKETGLPCDVQGERTPTSLTLRDIRQWVKRNDGNWETLGDGDLESIFKAFAAEAKPNRGKKNDTSSTKSKECEAVS